MEISLATPLLSRDGYLNKDPLMVNCYWEPTLQGGRTIVRRPALGPARGNGYAPPAGNVQGVMVSDNSYAFINDAVINLDSNMQPNSTALTVTNTGLRMSATTTYSSNGIRLTYMNFFKSTDDAWYWSSLGNITKVTNANYPQVTMPGVAYLDGTYYVLDGQGQIHGSDLEDPSSWNAANYVAVDKGIGKGYAIGRHLSYIVAFCANGTQFFYDAANPAPGSPLSPVPNATSSIGCAHAFSIQSNDDITIFLSQDKKGGRAFHMIEGLSFRKISTPDIERILERSPFAPIDINRVNTVLGATPTIVHTGYTQLYTQLVKADGRTFYIFTMMDKGLTLAYDLQNQHWAQWSTCTDGQTHQSFQIGFAVPGYMIPANGGASYPFGVGDQAGGEQILMGVRTRPLDAGTTTRKVCSELSLLGDTVAATMNIRYSNDYGQSWSAWRGINLGLARKRLTRLGMFVARVYEFSCYTSAKVRLESMVLPDRNLPAQTQPSGE